MQKNMGVEWLPKYIRRQSLYRLPFQRKILKMGGFGIACVDLKSKFLGSRFKIGFSG